MTKQHVLAIDCDDVLMEFNASFARFHNNVYGTKILAHEITSYEMNKVYCCSKETMRSRITQFCHSPAHQTTPPVSGAIEAIRHLHQLYTLDIVTSRPEEFHKPTLKWIQYFFPHTFRHFHFTNKFTGTQWIRKRLKSEVCREIGAKILIDDALHHAEDAAIYNIPMMLLDRPWNRSYTPTDVVRVQSWEEIIFRIDAFI